MFQPAPENARLKLLTYPSAGFRIYPMRQREQLEHRIRRLCGRAIGDFGLIQNNDRILVALSGGKVAIRADKMTAVNGSKTWALEGNVRVELDDK